VKQDRGDLARLLELMQTVLQRWAVLERDGDDASPEAGPGLLLDDFVRTRPGHLTTITAVLHPHLLSLKARPPTRAHYPRARAEPQALAQAPAHAHAHAHAHARAQAERADSVGTSARAQAALAAWFALLADVVDDAADPRRARTEQKPEPGPPRDVELGGPAVGDAGEGFAAFARAARAGAAARRALARFESVYYSLAVVLGERVRRSADYMPQAQRPAPTAAERHRQTPRFVLGPSASFLIAGPSPRAPPPPSLSAAAAAAAARAELGDGPAARAGRVHASASRNRRGNLRDGAARLRMG
jgi:hypothetical protein